MKATGIVRRIDDLGRVVIPKEIRRTMRIREGDPLEIYTSREGEVIFKKYSLLGGVEDFAAELCETMSRSTGSVCAVTDRDTVIAVAGGSKRELMGKRITPELEQIMESRKIYQYTGEGQPLQVTEGIDSLLTTVAAPILAEGDLLGLVLFISSDPAAVTGRVEEIHPSVVDGAHGSFCLRNGVEGAAADHGNARKTVCYHAAVFLGKRVFDQFVGVAVACGALFENAVAGSVNARVHNCGDRKILARDADSLAQKIGGEADLLGLAVSTHVSAYVEGLVNVFADGDLVFRPVGQCAAEDLCAHFAEDRLVYLGNAGKACGVDMIVAL